MAPAEDSDSPEPQTGVSPPEEATGTTGLDPTDILVELAIVFGQNCPTPVRPEAAAALEEIFLRTVGAALGNDPAAWNKVGRKFVLNRVVELAHEVHDRAGKRGATERVVRECADELVAKWKPFCLQERHKNIIEFCLAY